MNSLINISKSVIKNFMNDIYYARKDEPESYFSTEVQLQNKH